MRSRARKPPPRPPRPLRTSLYLPPDLLSAVLAQAASEERKRADMLRVLIQRGLRASRRDS